MGVFRQFLNTYHHERDCQLPLSLLYQWDEIVQPAKIFRVSSKTC
jgi:hypothetical protein